MPACAGMTANSDDWFNKLQFQDATFIPKQKSLVPEPIFELRLGVKR